MTAKDQQDDDESLLQEILELYQQGRRDDAFQLLDDLLSANPWDADARLLKAELSLRAECNPEFVGATAAGYRQQATRTGREQAVIDGATAWAERALEAARAELEGRYLDLDDGLRALRQATSLAPWDASLSLAGALMLLHMPGDDEDQLMELLEGAGFPVLVGRPQGQQSGKWSERMAHEARTLLRQTRERATPHERPWLFASLMLAQMLVGEGDLAAARALLAEAAQHGLPVGELLTDLETLATSGRLTEILKRVEHLLRQRELDRAAPIIEEVLMAAPDHPPAWIALADWLRLAGNVEAAQAVYRWLASGPQPRAPVDAARVEAALARASAEGACCLVCGRPLPPNSQACRVCRQPVPEDVLLTDRFALDGLGTALIGHIGLAVTLADLGQPEAAVSRLDELLPRLPTEHASREPLGALLAHLHEESATCSQSDGLAAALASYRRGDLTEARMELARLAALPRSDGQARAWLALTYAGDKGPDMAALAAVRGAINLPTAVWAATPLGERRRLITTLLAGDHLAEVRDLLVTLFTEEERRSDKVQRLVARCHKRIGDRCHGLAAEARRWLEEGQVSRASLRAGEALELAPCHLEALLVRGEAQLQLGAVYPAAACFQAAREVATAQEEIAAALLGLARVYEALDDLAEAGRLLSEAGDDRPEIAALRARLERRTLRQPAVRVEPCETALTADTLRRVPPAGPLYRAIFAVEVSAAARWQPNSRLAVPRETILRGWHAFVAMLGNLAGTLGEPSFELRLVSDPDPGAPARGRLRAALLCRVTHSIPEVVARIALEMGEALSGHLPMADDHLYRYEPVFDEADLARWLEPFEVRDGAEIVRRERGEGQGYMVYPFTSGGTALLNLARLLLRERAPAMVSIYLAPTRLLPWERAALRRSVEALQLVRLPDPSDEERDRIALDEPLRTAYLPNPEREFQVGSLAALGMALENQPFLLRVAVASAAPNNALLPGAVAAEVFGAGGSYEIARVIYPEELEALRANLRCVEAARWADSSAPETLARLRGLVSTVEAGMIFRLPMPDAEGVPGLPTIDIRADLPLRLPDEGTVLGESVGAVAGVPQIVRMRQEDRRRHVYIVGKTGVGKSTLIEAMALQDMEVGRGVAVLDPHGDLVESILTHVPAWRADDVIVFDPSDETRPIGLNFLEAETDSQRHRIATEFIQMLMRMYDPHQMGIVGPRFQHNVRMAMMTIMLGQPGATLVELVRALTDNRYVQELLPRIHDPIVKRYWTDQIARTSDFHKSEVLDYIVSKFDRFVGDQLVRNIIGQSRSTINFREVMDRRLILLVNLSKGKVGIESASFLGLLVLQSLLTAALSRVDTARDAREDFCLYVDEFQTFATENFAAMLSEGRKYGLCLVMANQYIHQLPDDLRQAVFGNVGSLVAFQVGVQDAGLLASEFYPVFGADDLLNIPRYTAAARLLVDGLTARPFALRTRLVRHLPDWAQAERIKAASRLRYGRDVEAVTRELAARAKLAA